MGEIKLEKTMPTDDVVIGEHRFKQRPMTKSVEEALAHPRRIDENLRYAQEARRVLDRLVGYDLSGIIWKKVRYGLSAGRVQSPALRIVMEREREIRAFIPEIYFVLDGDFETTEDKKMLEIISIKCIACFILAYINFKN